MTTAERQVLIARVKSFLWRLGGVIVVAGLNFIAQDIANWQLSPEWVMFLGLLVGELTKYLNSNVPWLRSVQQ